MLLCHEPVVKCNPWDTGRNAALIEVGHLLRWKKQGMCHTGFIIVNIFSIITVVISPASTKYILGNHGSMGHEK